MSRFMTDPCGELLTEGQKAICRGERGKRLQAEYVAHWLATGKLSADPRDVQNEGQKRTEPGKGSKEPGILKKAAKFARAAARHIADGAAEVSQEEREKRMAICASCDQFDAARTACRSCGCGLTLKARWRSEDCPLGKW